MRLKCDFKGEKSDFGLKITYFLKTSRLVVMAEERLSFHRRERPNIKREKAVDLKTTKELLYFPEEWVQGSGMVMKQRERIRGLMKCRRDGVACPYLDQTFR